MLEKLSLFFQGRQKNNVPQGAPLNSVLENSDLLSQVFSQLGNIKELKNASLVCHFWRTTAKKDIVFKALTGSKRDEYIELKKRLLFNVTVFGKMSGKDELTKLVKEYLDKPSFQLNSFLINFVSGPKSMNQIRMLNTAWLRNLQLVLILPGDLNNVQNEVATYIDMFDDPRFRSHDLATFIVAPKGMKGTDVVVKERENMKIIVLEHASAKEILSQILVKYGEMLVKKQDEKQAPPTSKSFFSLFTR